MRAAQTETRKDDGAGAGAGAGAGDGAGDGDGSVSAGDGSDSAGKRFWNIFDALSSRLGKVAPGSAVVEGIHAEGPVVADLGGLPPGEYTKMKPTRFEELVADMLPALKVRLLVLHTRTHVCCCCCGNHCCPAINLLCAIF